MSPLKDLFHIPSLSTGTTENKYIIMGVNLYEGVYSDEYRTAGILRLYSHVVEDNLHKGGYVSSLPVTDFGDIISHDLDALETDLKTFLRASKETIPILIGGDHLITLPVIRSVKPTAIAVFDAHLDLKDTYNFRRVSNATVFRRIHEEMGIPIYYRGVRGYSREELEYMEKNNDIFLDKYPRSEKLHISIDIDVLDPSLIQQVSYPEPNGWSLDILLKHVEKISRYNQITSIDIVEYRPREIRIAEISLILRLLYETIYLVETGRG